MQEHIEINDQFRQALEFLEWGSRSVFITGRAGTGKSTLLDYFRNTTGKHVAVLAPTGVAALNVKGQTIHSFFRFKPGITPDTVKRYKSKKSRDIYRRLDTIIIDEISMVRADLLDCVDRFLRLNGPDETKPFGGIQMAFIGDLYQLPPVVTSDERDLFTSFYTTPYFYGAKVFGSFEMEHIELDIIYRQNDDKFIEVLNAIRNNTVSEDDIALMNSRYLPEFVPPDDEMYVYLTTTNKMAEQINIERLEYLNTDRKIFTGTIDGTFRQEYLPTKVDLDLKKGAQIMLLNNDGGGRWVNGSIGKISSFSRNEQNEEIITASLEDGTDVDISPYTWEIYRFYSDGTSLRSETVGKFTQYPLMLAWAVTIHKSQGKTFSHVIVDTGRGTFAYGQMYVALSRCTSLEGIVLKKPFRRSNIGTNYRVSEFLSKIKGNNNDVQEPFDDMIDTIKQAIKDKIPLEMTYLKPNSERSERTVIPVVVGKMGFRGKTYLGMQAYCLKRKELRSFRLDRIVELKK